VIDGDGFEGLCAGCADKAKAENPDPGFDDHLSPVSFARVDRDSPAPGCWAVGFSRFAEAGPVGPAAEKMTDR
jgi:hypothetical protein